MVERWYGRSIVIEIELPKVVRARAEAVLTFDPENNEANAYLEPTDRALRRSAAATNQVTPSKRSATTPESKKSNGDSGKRKLPGDYMRR